MTFLNFEVFFYAIAISIYQETYLVIHMCACLYLVLISFNLKTKFFYKEQKGLYGVPGFELILATIIMMFLRSLNNLVV